MTDIFQPIVSRQNVEQQYIERLRAWLETYLTELERQNSIAPLSLPRVPAPESIYGGVDAGTWTEDHLPSIIVTAEPIEDPIHLATAYQQWFEVTVTAIVVSDSEDAARALADWYGAAVMGVFVQDKTNLDGWASDTILTQFPKAEFVPDERDTRVFAQSVTTFRSLISNVITEAAGPLDPIPDGQLPSDVPTVETTDLTFVAVPDGQTP